MSKHRGLEGLSEEEKARRIAQMLKAQTELGIFVVTPEDLYYETLRGFREGLRKKETADGNATDEG